MDSSTDLVIATTGGAVTIPSSKINTIVQDTTIQNSLSILSDTVVNYRWDTTTSLKLHQMIDDTLIATIPSSSVISTIVVWRCKISASLSSSASSSWTKSVGVTIRQVQPNSITVTGTLGKALVGTTITEIIIHLTSTSEPLIKTKDIVIDHGGKND